MRCNSRLWLACLVLSLASAAQAQSSLRPPESRVAYGQSEDDYLQFADPDAPVVRAFTGSGAPGSQYAGAVLADRLTHTLRARVDASSVSSVSASASYQNQFVVPDQSVAAEYLVSLRVDGLFSRLGALGATRVRAHFSVTDLDNTEVVFDENFNPSFNTEVVRFALEAGEDRFVDDGQSFTVFEGGWSLATNQGLRRNEAISTSSFDTGVLSIRFSGRPGATLTVFGQLFIGASGGDGPIAFDADLSRTFSADLFDAQGQQLDLPGLRNFDGSITAAVPEPHSGLLVLAGLAALAVWRRRR